MSKSDDCGSNLHEFCNRCDCECHGIELDKETARELLTTLEHQFINYKYTKVHSLILELQKFVAQ